MMDAKQHVEVMDALHTIGRNIAQQDAMRLRHVHALESLVALASISGPVIVVLWVVSMWVPR